MSYSHFMPPYLLDALEKKYKEMGNSPPGYDPSVKQRREGEEDLKKYDPSKPTGGFVPTYVEDDLRATGMNEEMKT